jgi:hypothetical protein
MPVGENTNRGHKNWQLFFFIFALLLMVGVFTNHFVLPGNQHTVW